MMQVDPVSLERTLKAFSKVNDNVRRQMNMLFEHTTLELETKAKRRVAENGSVNTGLMRSSIHKKTSDLRASVVVNAKYGSVVEYGRRPGKFPPVDAMRYWVKRKLRITGEREINAAAYMVGRKIARSGIPPRPFLFNTWDEMKPQFYRNLTNTLRKALFTR